MNDRKVVDGWEIVPMRHPIDMVLDITVRDGDEGLEQDRLISILHDLLTYAPSEIGYYFGEDHSGQEGFMEPDDFYETWDKQEYRTVYDSSLLNYVPESGYNIIEKAYGKWDEDLQSRDMYIALSMNGCSHASALTQHYKFTLSF